MQRRDLESLYGVSSASPNVVFKRALSEPIGRDAYEFLLDHASELDFESLTSLFRARVAEDVEKHPRRFLQRLVELVPGADDGQLLDILGAAEHIESHAWLIDVVLPLRGQLPDWKWYRFVDRAKGGQVFDALNRGLPKTTDWDPAAMFVTSSEMDRPAPLVLPVLDKAHDDLAVAQFAFQELPVSELLLLHAKVPDLVTAEQLKQVLPKRIRDSQPWLPPTVTRVPASLAPYFVERIRHCRENEARMLYEWLVSRAGEGDLFDLAVYRFETAAKDRTPGKPVRFHWAERIGERLTTGAAWKRYGGVFIGRCIDRGLGFPRAVIERALAVAEKSAEQAILRRAHEVAGRLLIERSEKAIVAGKHERAALFLSAFLNLDPGSFLAGPMHRLSKRPDLTSDLVDQVEACRILTRAGGRSPTIDGFLDAFLVLAGRRP